MWSGVFISRNTRKIMFDVVLLQDRGCECGLIEANPDIKLQELKKPPFATGGEGRGVIDLSRIPTNNGTESRLGWIGLLFALFQITITNMR